MVKLYKCVYLNPKTGRFEVVQWSGGPSGEGKTGIPGIETGSYPWLPLKNQHSFEISTKSRPPPVSVW